MKLLGLLLLVWLAEARAPRLPGVGFASCAYAGVLAGALLPELGPGPSALLLVLPILRLRWLDSLCMGAGLAAVYLIADAHWKALAGSLAYLLLAEWTPDLAMGKLPAAQRKRHNQIQSRLTGVRLGACALGVLLSDLIARNDPLVIASTPLIWLLLSQNRQVVALEEQEQRRDLVREVSAGQQRLEVANQTHQQLRLELSRSEAEVRLLQASARTFLQLRGCQQTADQLMQLAASLCRVQSVAVFLLEGEVLVPRSLQSPHARRLAEAPLLGLNEPVLHRTLHQQEIQTQPGAAAEARVFHDEAHVLVFPLGTLGVLYLGRPDPPFQMAELNYLAQAAQQGGLALQISLQFESLQRALEQQARISHELGQWTGAVDRLLNYSVEFLGQLSKEGLPERIGRAVQGLLCGDSLEICLEGSHPLQACQEVLKNRAPLLIEDISQTRFAPHRPGQASFLCVPIYHSQLPEVGLIIVGAVAPGSFHRLQRDILSLLAFLAAVAWKNAELYGQTLAAQTQLVQSSKMAAVGQLAAGVAHELNTPFGAIQMNLEMVGNCMTSNPARAQERLTRSLEVLDRARSIVEKLLYYSRLDDQGRTAIELDRVIQDTLELIDLDGIELQLQLGGPPKVVADPAELQQVLHSLLSNARLAVLEPDALARRLVVQSGSEAGRAWLTVTDFGCGIPPEIQPRVFDPFFTTRPVGEGTGLGLSIAQQIVHNHGGEISLQSQPGKGTRFRVQFPL
ncbi:MAG: ATP-binding protein [Vulcanimicrobiota bacterium]